jgi:hypothetical protein
MKYTPEKPRKSLDPGIYLAKITNAEEGFSQKGDEILELAFDVSDERGHSMKISDRLYNTEKARWRISVVRHAFGFEDPFGVETEFSPGAMIGKRPGLRSNSETSGQMVSGILKWLSTQLSAMALKSPKCLRTTYHSNSFGAWCAGRPCNNGARFGTPT